MNAKSENLIAQNIDTWIAAHREEIVDALSRLVSIRSVSVRDEEGPYPFGRGCAQALDCALSMARELGMSTRNLDYYCGTATGLGDGKSGSIGIIAHLDIVPEGSGWSFPPFDAQQVDGFLVGRGTDDDKGPAVVALYAVKCMMDLGVEMKHAVKVILGCAEETGMEDVAYYREHDEMPLFTFTPDTSFPVCNGEKGILTADLYSEKLTGNILSVKGGTASNMIPDVCELTLDISGMDIALLQSSEFIRLERDGNRLKVRAEGISGHAAFPEGSENAIRRLAAFVLEHHLLTGNCEQAMQGVLHILYDYYGAGLGIALADVPSGRLTHNGGILSLDADGRMMLNVNIRYPVTAQGKDVVEQMTRHCAGLGFTVDHVSDDAPTYIPSDSAIIQTLTQTCNEVLGTRLAPYVMGGGTYARHLPNAVAFGPGIPGSAKPFPQGHGGAHEPDECVNIDDLLKALKIYVLSLIRLDTLV